MVSLVGQRGVNFVREDEQIVFADERRDLREFVAGHRRAGRVVRVTQHEHLGVRRPRRFERVTGQYELVVRGGRNRKRVAARKRDARNVRDVRRLRNRNCVAGIDKRAHGEVDGLARSGSHQNLAIRIVLQIVSLDVVGNRLSEVSPPSIGGVGRFPALQRVDCGGAGGPRRGEIRLSDAQRDDVVSLLREFEEAANPRRRNSFDAICRFHGETERRSSSSRSSNWMPRFLYVSITKCVTVWVTSGIGAICSAMKFDTSCIDSPCTSSARS